MSEDVEIWRGLLADASDEELAHHYDEIGTIGMDAAQIKRAQAYFAAPERGQVLFPTGTKDDRNELRCYPIYLIQISPSRRDLDETVVARLVDSISKIGLIHPPIIMRRDGVEVDGEKEDGVPVLIAGRHRLEAWRRLGNRSVPCVVVDANEINAELLEISENLHRAELTVLERDEQVARWIELTGAKKEAEVISAQIAPKSAGRPESGINAAARALGIERTDAQRATKVASLAPEAKQAAVEAGLDDNRSVLLAAAKEKEPAKQVAVIQARATPPPSTSRQYDDHDADCLRFMSVVAEIEPLLIEIEHRGYADDDEDEDGEPTFAYSHLSYLEIAERYKPVMGAFRSVGRGKGTDAAIRRIRNARDELLFILCRTAQAELEAKAFDTFDGAPIPRTPEFNLEAI